MIWHCAFGCVYRAFLPARHCEVRSNLLMARSRVSAPLGAAISYESLVVVTFFSLKRNEPKKSRGCVVSLLKVLLWQGLWFPQHANAALGS
jgi:hypothetical protein